jgi:hypothetical protein
MKGMIAAIPIVSIKAIKTEKNTKNSKNFLSCLVSNELSFFKILKNTLLS